MPFVVWGGVGDSHHVLDGGPDPPTVRDNFGVGKGPSHSKVWGKYMKRQPWKDGGLDRVARGLAGIKEPCN